MSGIVIPRPDDFHVHLRDGGLMKRVLPYTAGPFGRALVMPNLAEPVTTAPRMLAYRDRIKASAGNGFEPLMSIYLTPDTTPEIILEAARAGAIACKFYPKSATTNSDHGLDPGEFFGKTEWFEAMQQAGLVLCLHAEMNAIADELAREHAFLKLLLHARLPKRFPKLRFVIEHISTAAGIDFVQLYANVGGTITLHHLMLTHEDARANPHHFCMPIPKTTKDVQALNRAVLFGKNRRIFFGSDSAPHVLATKVGVEKPKAGVFSSPVLLPKLAEHFVQYHRSQRLIDFVACNGAEFYGLPQPTGHVELVPERFHAPDPDEDPEALIPFLAGRPISWSVRY